MNEDVIGLGVVGLGFMGQTHVSAFAGVADCRLVAVADHDESRLSGVFSEGGNLDTGVTRRLFDPESLTVARSVDELLGCPDVQLVSITTPTPTHEAIALAVIESGKHLLVEKPVALDAAAILRISEAARSKGVLAMPGHCMRFWPAWTWMRDRIRDSTYGKAVKARFLRTGAAPDWNDSFYLDEKKSGGAIVDLHIHDSDFILACFGMPESVSSQGSRRHVETTYHYPEGPEVVAEGGWLDVEDAPFTMTATIEFESAVVRFALSEDPEVTVESSEGVVTGRPEASEGGTGYEQQAAALIAAIRNGSSEAPVTLREAAETARLLEAEIASIDGDGTSVSL